MRLWARGDLRIPSAGDREPEQQLQDAFTAFGLKPEEEIEVEDECYLWPENVLAFNLWLAVQTQWQWVCVPAGLGSISSYRTGLNYPGVQACIKHLAIPKHERSWYFGAVQMMERTALNEWNRER